jgi:PST family polysaccharide transporter
MAAHAHARKSLKETLFWAFTMSWGTQLLGNLIALVLAIKLGPHEFGTVAIAFVVLNLLQVLLSQGLEDTLVQRYELDESHLNSAFWYLATCGGMLWLLCLAASRWWAAKNGQPVVETVIRVLSLKIPLFSLTIVQRAVRVRQMGFKGLAIIQNIAEGSAGLLAIGMAGAGCGLWALVGQQLARDTVSVSLLWGMSKWRPKFYFSWRCLRNLLPFSLPSFAGEFGLYLRGQVDVMLVGLFFGPTAVGLYRLADRIRDTVLTLVTRSLQWVSLPSLSKLQKEPVAFRQLYLKLLKISVAATVPLMACLAALNSELVSALGARWHGAETAIAIMCVIGCFESFTVITTPLLQASSRPMAVAWLVWVSALTNIAFVAVFGFALKGSSISSQVNGMALCKLLSFLLAFFPLNLILSRKTSGASLLELLTAAVTGVLAALGASLACWLLHLASDLIHVHPLLEFGIPFCLAMTMAGGVALALNPEWRLQLRRVIGRGVFRTSASREKQNSPVICPES